MKKLIEVVSVASLAFVGAAQANTITFSGLGPDYDPAALTYQEGGATVSSSWGFLTNYPSPYQLDFYEYAYRMFSISNGGVFQANSFSLQNLGSSAELITVTDPPSWAGWTSHGVTSFENVLVQGFLGGRLVATKLLDMYEYSQVGNWATVQLSGTFKKIDRLEIGFSYSTDQSLFIPLNEAGSSFVWCSDPPCSSFSVDDISLAPVPLPTGAMPFGAALALLSGQSAYRWRKKSRRAHIG